MSLLVSCQYLGIEQKKMSKDAPIAQVHNSYLYLSDIKHLIPENTSKEDSVLLVKGLVTSWAKKELFLYNASLNLSKEKSDQYDKLVQDYRQSLLINGYKERLVKQKLDTTISSEEVYMYYELHKSNFKLNEELLKIKYLHFGKDLLHKDELISLFKSDDPEDMRMLENQGINFKEINLNDSTWVKLEDVLLKISKFREIPKETLLKKTKFLQKEDSLGLYLVAVNDVLKRNDIAPLNYISPTIRQIILHKRKLELIREIEKTLINDAIQNKNFKEY